MTTSPIPEGEDLRAFFSELPPGAWVMASGLVEGLELAVPHEGAEREERVLGRVMLCSLQGPAGGPWFVTVSAERGGRSEVFGGRLVKARSAGVSYAAFGGATPEEPARAAPSPPAAGKGSGAAAHGGAWADLAQRSAAAADDDEPDELPKYGDRVDHFVFGLCDVMVVRGDRLKIRDVNGPGRLREIAIGAVRVLPFEEHDGKRVFRLVKRG